MSQSTSIVSNYIETVPTTRHKKKHSRDSHIICQAAVSKTSAPGQGMLKREPEQEGLRGDPGGGRGVGRLKQPVQKVLLAGPNIQSRNAFKSSKGTKKTKREREREAEGEGGICASLWETLLVLIYTSMTTAQNELTMRRTTTNARRKNTQRECVVQGKVQREGGNRSLLIAMLRNTAVN